MKIPSDMIAATRAKSGKTLVSCAVMSSLTKLGFKIQPFKVGPDFIDPSYHSIVTNSQSRNLDKLVQIKGIILNNVGTRRQEEKIRTAIRTFMPDIEILGAIPRSTAIEEKFKYRHLGLIPTAERAQDMDELKYTIGAVANYLDIPHI